jgi:hypothetical protein
MKVKFKKNIIILRPFDSSVHYGVSFALIIILIINFCSNLYYGFWNNENIVLDVSLLILSIVVAIRQKFLLELTIINTIINKENIKEQIIKITEINNWEIENNTSEYLIVRINKTLSTECLIIKFSKNGFYIGSINHPGSRNSFGSMIKYKKNKKMIIQKILELEKNIKN